MDNKPDDPGWPEYEEPFGENWNLDEQCRQEFGSDYQLCRAFGHTDPCHYLWCSTYEKPLLCTTKRGAPLPGTTCGQDMVNIALDLLYSKTRQLAMVSGTPGTVSTWRQECSEARIQETTTRRYQQKACASESNNYLFPKL